MGRIIKITEEQFRKIQETIDDEFVGFSNSDVKPYDGHTNISADGKLNGEENGNPMPSDKMSKSLTPQSYSRYNSYGRIMPRSIREDHTSNHNINADFKSFGVHTDDTLDLLSNGDNDDDLTIIPNGIDEKTEGLINLITSSKLTCKQQAIILNRFIEGLDITGIPYQWKKELMAKIKV